MLVPLSAHNICYSIKETIVISMLNLTKRGFRDGSI